MPECDYCGSSDLAYELESGKGPVCRCIPCLAVEQGQQKLTLPFESFIDFDSPVYDSEAEAKEAREASYNGARDWYTILARIRQNDPLIKRDPEDYGTVNDDLRTFLTNIMGSAAHYSPSEIIDADGDPGQTTLTDGDSDA